MMNRKFVIATASLLVLSSMNVFAQNNEEPKTNKTEYNTNWFVGVGAGINTMSTFMSGDSFNIHLKGNGYDTHVEPGAEIFFGKWYTPRFGVRFGVQGGKYSTKLNVPYESHFTGLYGHGDFMWAATSWLTPYAHAGIQSLFTEADKNHWANENEMIAGIGFMLNAKLSDKVALYFDTRSNLMPQRVVDNKESRFSSILSYSVGMKYNLEKYGESKKSFVGSFAQPYTTEYASNLADDMFVQIGGGINTLQSNNGYGWDGRITPAYELAIGKWMTNTFGVRVGLQGHSFSHWGQEGKPGITLEQGIYKDQQLYKERFGFEYAHFDLLWDVTSMIGGYTSQRFWSVIPYLHGGYMIGFTNIDKVQLLNNEWAAGAGLLNTFRVNDNLSLFLDARAFGLNHCVTNDAQDGYTLALTGLAGIYYDLNTQRIRNHNGVIEGSPLDLSSIWPKNIHHEGPYIYNGILDNWFIGGAAGIASLSSSKPDTFKGELSTNWDAYVGKWFSPSFGMRIGLQGANYKFDTLNDANINYLHGDLMWNILNTTNGYKGDRIYSLIPYTHAGLIATMDEGANSINRTNFGAGVGLLNSIALNDRLRFNVDLRSTFAKNRIAGNVKDGNAIALAALGGLSIDLGKNYWGPGEGILINDIWDNWFIQAAGGVGTIGHKIDGVGFNGRITPAEEIMIGKWFSPTVGVRAGVQGVALSQWGSKPLSSVDYLQENYRHYNLEIEKFASYYTHADMLFNLTNAINYNEERTFDVIPYSHVGYYSNYSSNTTKSENINREYAIGGGIIISKDLDDKVSLYTDLRGSAYKHHMTSDVNAKYAWGASATVGLTYNLGGGKSDIFDSNSWRHLPEGRFDEEMPATRWAISTNLYDYADLGTVNVEVQRVLGRHITSDMIAKANLWNFKGGEMRDNRQDFQLGVRYWPWYTYSGIYVKGFAQVEEYATGNLNKFLTLGRGEGPEKGSAYGVGAGFGYSLMLAKHFNLDFGLTGWAGYRDYFKFNDAKFSKPIEHNHKMFAAPADFNISLMWVF